FFFSSRRRHTRFDCDWSSDVCSSDLLSSSVGKRLQRSYFRSALILAMIALFSSSKLSVRPLVKIQRALSPAVEGSVKDFISFLRSEERRVGKEWRSELWRLN